GVTMTDYECDICGQEFEEEKGKYIHVGMEHPDEAQEELGLICPSCGKEFESSKVLETHRSEVHSQASSSSPSQLGSYFSGLRDKDRREFLTDYWKSLTFILLIAALVVLQSGMMDVFGSSGVPRYSGGGSPSGGGPPGNVAPSNRSGNSTAIPSGVPDDLPEKTKYNACDTHKDCAATCCGAYNQANMDMCSDAPPCNDGSLHVAMCVQGRCVSTNQEVPSG
ncbi:MAG: C2H2-type zinc finger protein, partial [Candidatus Nanohaloarchaea archaeon]